jgi:hypothetical protein
VVLEMCDGRRYMVDSGYKQGRFIGQLLVCEICMRMIDGYVARLVS